MCKFPILLFFALSAQFHLSCQNPVYYQVKNTNYTAAVVEWHSLKTTKENAKLYAKSIPEIAEDTRADIIIFPEGTLTVKPEDGSIVPRPEDKVIPFKNKTYTPNDPMYMISEAAVDGNAYVVINLYERVKNATGNATGLVYNTNVVFDRSGMVIARYRKYHVYVDGVRKPDKAVLSTFTTDFGVTFGMFTSFDIHFKTPAIDLVEQKKIKNIIFPAWWTGELPLLTGPQVQNGWSYAMNVNLFASGANEPSYGGSGIGMYFGRDRKFSRMSDNETSWVFFDRVPAKAMTKTLTTPKPRVLKFASDPTIPKSTGKDLNVTSGNFRDKICNNGLCCNFRLKYAQIRGGNPRYKYRAVVFQGKRSFGSHLSHDVGYCAVVLCTDGDCTKRPVDGNYTISFDELVIDGEFRKTETFQMPTTLHWNKVTEGVVPLDTMPYYMYSYNSTVVTGKDLVNVGIQLKIPKVKTLVTFGIFARDFK